MSSETGPNSELARITEGILLLRAHGCHTARTYQSGLFIVVPRDVLSVALAREMKALGWLWHHQSESIEGYYFPLSPL